MDIATAVGTTIQSVDFGFLSTHDIKKLSVKQVTNPEEFDNLGHPVASGLYDLSLGAFSKNLCMTCGLDERFCLGHIGHIDLPVPVYNPMFFSYMYILLRSSCLYCHHLRLKSSETNLFECQLRLLQHGLVLECEKVEDIKGEDANARNEYTSSAIKEALESGFSSSEGVRTPAILEQRKNLIKEFYKRILSRPKCENCQMYSPKFRKDGLSKIFEINLSDRQINHNRVKGIERKTMIEEDLPAATGPKGEAPTSQEEDLPQLPKSKAHNGSRFVLSIEVNNILRQLFKREQAIFKAVFQLNPASREYVSADMFFAHTVVVPPTRFRAPSELGGTMHSNPMNDLLGSILTGCLRIRDLSEELYGMQLSKEGDAEQRKLLFTQLMNQFVTLQNNYNGVLDATKNQGAGAKGQTLPGIKQVLERKEGLFRKNMMGKRVNFAARSVISPDPNIETNEIGIPPVFAVKLTYPEPVTSYNFDEMREAVVNGPDVWPGATQIQNEDGKIVSLLNTTVEQRTALANQLMTPSSQGNVGVNKKVHRHIRNHDVVLMNRQPTLHKASMMGHNVRVLPKEKTLRLHYANTGAYNADFDGDEMNMHFPQNEAARAEALLIANTNNQYLTPTSGKPLRGLIQDHISAGVWLTSKDSLFTRDQYQQLVCGSVRPETGQFASDRVLLLPPTIHKPQPMWTGKQVISTILLNIRPPHAPGLNLTSKNKVKNEYWGKQSEENAVIIKDGQLLCGILDKSQYGAADYGLVHSVHEVYGPDSAGLLLSVLGRLFTKYIMETAFTCGMDDLRLTTEGDQWRRDLLNNAESVGTLAAAEVTNMPADTKQTDAELRKRLEEILRDDNKLAILDAITQGKANAVTTSVVSRCIPDGTEKRFPKNSMQSMALSGAKGSNVNVSQIMCALGQQALEGRRVPVMVSGKTLPTFKPYETHVRAGGYIANRFYSGVRPQEYYFHCMAGREGLIDTAVKTSRSGYLQRCLIKQLEGVNSQYDNTVRDSDGSLVQFMYGGDAVDTVKESYLQQFDFCLDNFNSLLRKHSPSIAGELDDVSAPSYVKRARKSAKKGIESEPVISELNPAKFVGSVSERFQHNLDTYIDDNKAMIKSKGEEMGISKLDKKFRRLMQLKYQQSLVDPGDCVGIVASQSIGEPSTQMTLNTFHFAGHGAANVTLGIPRMREIIMTASAHIKTPQMVLPIAEGVSDDAADAFCRGVTKIMLSQMIENVVVTERMRLDDSGLPVRSYSIRINLFNREEYEEEYDVSQQDVESILSTKFLTAVESQITKELRRQRKVDDAPIAFLEKTKPKKAPKIKKKQSESGGEEGLIDDEAEESGEEDSDSDLEEDDAKQGNKKQSVSYDDDEEGEEGEEVESSGSESGSSDDSESSSSSSESEIEDGEQMEIEDPMADVEVKEQPKEEKFHKKLNTTQKERENLVIGMHKSVKRYNFDDAQGQWCEFELEFPAELKKLLMVNLIEDVCRAVVVREVPSIERCLRPAQHKEGRVMVTEGVNFSAMWNEDLFIDVNGILSNDVAAVLRTYGVEAARNTIVREISNVFETYAIAVNPRHLELIADMMTREGSYLPFNRQGIDLSSSPFLKMSYESTCQFLTREVLNGSSDTLQSPSSRIVLGCPVNTGTGAFDVFAPLA